MLAWWWMLRSRRYTVLRDLVVEAPGSLIQIALMVVSTRGLFIVEALDDGGPEMTASARESGRNSDLSDCYDGRVRRCEERARQLAHVLDESVSFVSPILVLAGVLPANRPAHVVSGRGVVDYIRRYRVEVFSSDRIQQIVSQLSQSMPVPTHPAT